MKHITRTFAYDANSNLVQEVDALGRTRDFTFDALNRQTGEQWLQGGTVVNTISTSYNADGEVTAAGDSRKLLGPEGAIVIDSCHGPVDPKQFVEHYDRLADQLGYAIKVPSGSGIYDPETGVGSLDGPWVIFHPRNGSSAESQDGGTP